MIPNVVYPPYTMPLAVIEYTNPTFPNSNTDLSESLKTIFESNTISGNIEGITLQKTLTLDILQSVN